jgi:hypothetical protein
MSSAVPPSTNTQTDLPPDPFLPLPRRAVWILFILAIANGGFLYLLPHLAETMHAWSIKPPINAAFMGAGYLGGTVATALALFGARYWRSVRPFIWPFFALAAALIIATLIHADRFVWSYPLTWVWTATYTLIPPLAVVIWFVHERAVKAHTPLDARLNTIRLISWLPGIVMTVLGVVLYVTPESFLSTWPWQITPLLGQAFAAWYLLAGVMSLFVAFSARQAHELIIPASTIAVWDILTLLLPVLYSGDMHSDSAAFWLWIVLHGVSLVIAAYTLWRGIALSRDESGKIIF